MKYYKLLMDLDRPNDIVAHCINDFGIEDEELTIGKEFQGWDDRFKFFYDKTEGTIATDYLANDMCWFVVSDKLKIIMETMNSNIQFLPIEVLEKESEKKLIYYVANILKLVDALCLEKSDYFETDIPNIGIIYTISNYAIYEKKVQNIDIFKLSGNQEIPIFISEDFKEAILKNDITGIDFLEVKTI